MKKMNCRTKAMVVSLSLMRFANQMDQWEAEGISRDPEKIKGLTRYTFWFLAGPRNFKTTKEIRDLAKKIAREGIGNE